MKLHEREFITNKAGPELSLLILKFQEEKGLTDIELLQALHSFQLTTLKYMLRVERHGDSEKPAGIA